MSKDNPHSRPISISKPFSFLGEMYDLPEKREKLQQVTKDIAEHTEALATFERMQEQLQRMLNKRERAHLDLLGKSIQNRLLDLKREQANLETMITALESVGGKEK